MKKIILMALMLFLSFPVIYASLCSETVSIYSLPCVLITPTPYMSCSTHTATIYSESGQYVNSSALANFTSAINYCYINFSQGSGKYIIFTDKDDIAKITVTPSYDEPDTLKPSMDYASIILTVIWLVIMIIALKTRNKGALVINALFTMMIGIIFYFILPFTLWIKIMLSMIIVLAGIIFLAYAMFG